MTNISITLTSILTDEIVAASAAMSEAGNPVGIVTFAIYTRTRGISDTNIQGLMAQLGASDRLVMLGRCPEGTDYDDWVSEKTPIIVQAFKDMADGIKTCIHMHEDDYLVAIKQDAAKAEIATYLISKGYATAQELGLG